MSGVTLICQRVPIRNLRDHNGWVLQKLKDRNGKIVWGRIAEHVDSPHNPKAEPGWVWVLVYSDSKIGYPVWHEFRTVQGRIALETEICFKYNPPGEEEE